MKYCEDCKHMRLRDAPSIFGIRIKDPDAALFARCAAAAIHKTDFLVYRDAKNNLDNMQYAAVARGEYGDCKAEALLYEPK